jgi:hypothetical protein
MYNRGLQQFCSEQGGKAQEYVDISSLSDAAMSQIGQIRRTAKWLPSQPEMSLKIEPLSPSDISGRYVRHFVASKVHLIGPDPNDRPVRKLRPDGQVAALATS